MAETHVRRLGWERYDTPAAVTAINDLYAHDLRLQRRFGLVLRLGGTPARLKRQHRSVTSPVAR